ncbi:MAG: septum formation initiator family protein [Bacteroidales bacterium]|nr:septum formation initiator family protein [Bacteroidales bacterium]
MDAQQIWKKILPRLKNKFILTTLVFLLWLIVFDRSNWFDMIGEIRSIHSLEDEKEYYQKKIETDRQRLNELKTNDENLEKFAREQYLMKKPNEDIFIVEE